MSSPPLPRRGVDQNAIDESISSLRINLDVINEAMRQRATSESVDVVSSLMLEVQETKDQLQGEAERLVEGGQYGSTDKIFEAISEVSHVESEFGEWSKAVEQQAARQPQRHDGDTAESPAVDNDANSPALVVGKEASSAGQRSEAAVEKQLGEVNPSKFPSTEPKTSEKTKKNAENGPKIFWPAATATRGRSRRGASKRGKSRERKQQTRAAEKTMPTAASGEDLGWPSTGKKVGTSPTPSSAREAIAAWDAFAAPDLKKTVSESAEEKKESAANESRKGNIATSPAQGVWGVVDREVTNGSPALPTLPIPRKQDSSSSRENSIVAAAAENDGLGVIPSAVVTAPASYASGRMKFSLTWEDVKDLYSGDKQEAKKAIQKQFVDAVSSSLHIDSSRVRVRRIVV